MEMRGRMLQQIMRGRMLQQITSGQPDGDTSFLANMARLRESLDAFMATDLEEENGDDYEEDECDSDEEEDVDDLT